MEPDDKFLALASDVLQCTFRNDSVISSTLWPANLRVLESLPCSLLPPVAIRKWEFILLKIYVAKLSVPIIILLAMPFRNEPFGLASAILSFLQTMVTSLSSSIENWSRERDEQRKKN